jgi:hypothetical protein
MARRTSRTRSRTTPATQIQVNVRVERALHDALGAVAREERRSIAQAARQLMEEGLRHRTAGRPIADDLRADEIGELAQHGGAFDWLREEPDLYDEGSGEPL